MRIVAGPNGSGKSTLIETLKPIISLGIYVNADDIEAALKKKPVLHFEDFSIQATLKQFSAFVNKKTTIGTFSFKEMVLSKANVSKNILVIDSSIINSYFASLVADFIRQQLLLQKVSFSFETVMSHPSKLSMIDVCNKKGYQTYLYFVATNSPVINYGRIKNRVAKGGHNVSKQKAEERYERSLSLLKTAISKSYRAFIFDNTVSLTLMAEYKEGIRIKKYATYSNWFKSLFID